MDKKENPGPGFVEIILSLLVLIGFSLFLGSTWLQLLSDGWRGAYDSRCETGACTAGS